MAFKLMIISIIILQISDLILSEKFNLDSTINNSEFLNYGDKKLSKFETNQLENSVIKSKLDTLSEIFRIQVDLIKTQKQQQLLDLVFLIDSSSSIGGENFQSELKFVKKFLSDITVDFNHTRVAVITFSSNVVTHIDEITTPNYNNNKCKLLNNELNQIEYNGGGTWTLGAFKRAQEIFKSSRNESQRVLFLITDGFSNGGSPIPIANQLKTQQNVVIFTIGIRNGNYKELYEISTQPGEYFSYLLDSFQEFENLARRALHVDYKTGEYVPLVNDRLCNNLCNSTNQSCCDKNAYCACGTTTGHYSCICQPGYYGSGLRNSCLPCPSGSYSNGLNLCLPCPDMYHTTKIPSYSIDSCKCKIGYQSTIDNHCEILKCPKIILPKYGYFVKKRDCDIVYNSACGIRCEVGYSLIGSSIRLCQLNATWSGEQPACQIKTCSKLQPPQHGSMICTQSDLGITYDNSIENLPVDTVCTFKCAQGKSLIGSTQRTCLPLARWDGLKTSCKQIKCPKLPELAYGFIEPKSCTTTKQTYGTQCKISCQRGFKLKGPNRKTCTDNYGLWDSDLKSSRCIDVQPPLIKCPKNITITAEIGEKYGLTYWESPTVIDNSDGEISVWMKPTIKNIDNYKFPIGHNRIIYFAKDSWGNRAKCSFFIIVEDKEKPIIEDCDNPPTYLSNEKFGANITWDDPHIYDNSQQVNISRSHDFGFFPFGTTSINYTAVDPSGNRNMCIMNITIEPIECEPISDPIYGNSQCNSIDNGMECVITCQEGYALPLPQQSHQDDDRLSLICLNAEAKWQNSDNNSQYYPECSTTELPKYIEQSGIANIIDNNDDNSCNQTNLEGWENLVKNTLETTNCFGNCSIQTQSDCEQDFNTIARIKREIDENSNNHQKRKKRINIKFQIRTNYNGQLLNATTIGKNNITFHYNPPKYLCPNGYIIRKKRCVQCPKGTFHNTATNHCQSCPFGYYNDKFGQNRCTRCPLHYSTRKLRSKKFAECREQCPPGTFAKKKTIKRRSDRMNSTKLIERPTLRPYCRLCPIGTYQNYYGQIQCLACPFGYTTLKIGADHVRQCQPTAYHLCKTENLCQNGGECIAENDLHYSCKCLDDYLGSNCERKRNICDSNPCFNHATCEVIKDSILCHCLKGYKGEYCEETDDKCILHCLNGGTCYQNDPNDYFCLCPPGYGGDTCEIDIKFCHINNICENNGTCTELLPYGYQCNCTPGYIGKRCNLLPCDYKPCKPHQICNDLMVENATQFSYKCFCPDGFTGDFCNQTVDFCRNSPCLNNGTCINLTNSYRCNCTKLFVGDHCEIQRKIDYILNFEGYSTTQYVKLNGFNSNLSEITVCLWLKTNDNINYGTIISYATQNYDNTFTITDYGGLTLYVNNQYIVTDIVLNDGNWHHFCAIWMNQKGTYKFYLDGRKVLNGTGLGDNHLLKSNGILIIGQEQDSIGGGFSQTESFNGRMTEIDIWSRQLTDKQIDEHLNNCNNNGDYGDLYAWPEIYDNIHGDIKIENSTFCRKCNEPKSVFNAFINITDNIAYYQCYSGYELHGLDGGKRRCLKSGKWEGIYEPYCKKVYCGYPGNVLNGYTIGNNYYYKSTIIYKCYDGYKLNGTNIMKCMDNGKWHPNNKPQCSIIECKQVEKPENSLFNITKKLDDLLLNDDYDNGTIIYTIGSQIEMICENNTKLVGNNQTICLENGTWDKPLGECIADKPKIVSCDVKKIPPPPNNGYIDIDSLNGVGNGTGNFIKYKCRTGYQLFGDSLSTCIIDGYWTQPNISCQSNSCEKPQFKNMLITDNIDNYKFGSMVKMKCIDGYRTIGDTTIRCLANGKWSRLRGKCARLSCRKPDVLESTIIKGNSYLFEDKVRLICPDKREYILECNQYGSWIGDKGDNC